MADADAAVERDRVRGPLALWLALLAGPAAASLQLSVNYALVKWACAAGASWVLVALTAGFLALALAGIALGTVHFVSVRGGHPVAQTWSAQSRRLLAVTAIGLNALIAVFLINALIAIAALSPCE
jgi:hypothetical protein